MHRRRVTAVEFERMTLAERHDLLQLQMSRRGLLRSAAAMTLLGSGPLLVPASVSRADSGSGHIRSRWIAFGADPRTQMTIHWETSGPVRNPRVRFGLDPEYGDEVPAEPRPLVTLRPDGARWTQYYFSAQIAGLTAGTRFHYQVVHDGESGEDVTSEDASFRTAPKAGSTTAFRFTAFGDQDVVRKSMQMEQIVADLDPSFHLLAGDIAYADSSGEGLASDNYEPEKWGRYFAQVDWLARSLPWMAAVGNHEMEALYSPHGYGGFEARFSMPANGPRGCPGTYSFVYGNVGVISLDANDVTEEYHANRGYSGGAQQVWAEQRLRELRAKPSVDFVVALFHECAYSTAKHGSDLGVRREFGTLCDRYGVDLAISGHNHIYERTDPIRGGRPTGTAASGDTVHPIRSGTTYVVVGGGGAELSSSFQGKADRNDLVAYGGPDEVRSPTQGGRDEYVGWSRTRYTGHCVLVVDVQPSVDKSPPTMTLRAINDAGETVDTLTLMRGHRSFLDEHEEAISATAAGLALAAGGGGVAAVLRRRSRPAARAAQGDVGEQ